jgi:hypothetical protein
VTRGAIALALTLCAASGALAQIIPNAADWQESPVPPPPAFEPSRMLDFEMSRKMDLRYGVDPNTIVITGDGVVRYVVIATREGAGSAVNAFYEGVRCSTGEAKVYARYSGTDWQKIENPEWKSVGDMPSRHTLALARQAICRSGAPRGSVNEMVQVLKKPLLY